jgi:MFS family permease
VRKTLRLPVYRRLLVAYGLNELAWSVGTLALSVLVYRRTGSALGSTAFFLCAQVLPALVTPVLVARLDQRPFRTLLPALYTLEAVIFGVLAWMAGSFAIGAVLVLAFADGAVAVVARSFSRTATVAELVPADLLPEGNALTNAVFSVCFMAGPAIGGAVVVAGGTVAALLANCGIFAAIAVVLATAGLTGPAPDVLSTGRRLRAALSHVRAARPLRRMISLQAAGVIFFSISVPVEVVFAQQTLHSGAGGYGALLSAWGAGAVAGSAFYARWRRQSARVLIAASAASLACGFGVMAVAPTLAVAIVGAALGGVSNGVEMVAMRTDGDRGQPQRVGGPGNARAGDCARRRDCRPHQPPDRARRRCRGLAGLHGGGVVVPEPGGLGPPGSERRGSGHTAVTGRGSQRDPAAAIRSQP